MSSFALSNVPENAAVVVAGVSFLGGGWIGSKLAGRAKRVTDSKSESGIAKFIVWFLVIAIIVVGTILFFGQNL